MCWGIGKDKNQKTTNKEYFTQQSSLSEGDIKPFPNKEKLREFITTNSVIQEMLEGGLQAEVKQH